MIEGIARYWPELADLVAVSRAHGNSADARLPNIDIDAILNGELNVVVGLSSYAPWSQVGILEMHCRAVLQFVSVTG